ncbi:MAG: hypothetical protein JOZ57_07505 [Abitibacteriaceae bacterium]|nr:hypothetical protein [Abditibacteriaceae bacterium]
MYLKGAANALLQLDLPAGNYHVARVDVLTGQTVQSYNLQHGGGHYSLPVPANFREVAVKIVRF